MFTTTTQITPATADHEAHARRLLSDVDTELRELRMLARAGDLPERDAQLLLGAAEQRAARRRARLLTLGRDTAASTLELEAWHGNPNDGESVALRADLRASGLL